MYTVYYKGYSINIKRPGLDFHAGTGFDFDPGCRDGISRHLTLISVAGTGRASQIVSNRSTQCATCATALRTACGIA